MSDAQTDLYVLNSHTFNCYRIWSSRTTFIYMCKYTHNINQKKITSICLLLIFFFSFLFFNQGVAIKVLRSLQSMIVLEYIVAHFEGKKLCAELGSLMKLSTSILYEVSVH
jgi:hypothetical protein